MCLKPNCLNLNEINRMLLIIKKLNKRITGISRMLGKAVGNLRKATSNINDQLVKELEEQEERPLEQHKSE